MVIPSPKPGYKYFSRVTGKKFEFVKDVAVKGKEQRYEFREIATGQLVTVDRLFVVNRMERIYE